MKKLTLLLLLLSIACGAFTQEKRDTIRRQPMVAQRVNMKNELGLSRDQAKQLKGIHQEFRAKAETIKSDEALTHQERHRQLKALNELRQRRMDSLLTPDQRKKAAEIRKMKLEQKKEGKE